METILCIMWIWLCFLQMLSRIFMSFEDACMFRSVRVGFCTTRFLHWWFWMLQSMADSAISSNFSRVFHAFLHLHTFQKMLLNLLVLSSFSVSQQSNTFFSSLNFVWHFWPDLRLHVLNEALKNMWNIAMRNVRWLQHSLDKTTWMPRRTELGGYLLSVSVQFQGPSRWDHRTPMGPSDSRTSITGKQSGKLRLGDEKRTGSIDRRTPRAGTDAHEIPGGRSVVITAMVVIWTTDLVAVAHKKSIRRDGSIMSTWTLFVDGGSAAEVQSHCLTGHGHAREPTEALAEGNDASDCNKVRLCHFANRAQNDTNVRFSPKQHQNSTPWMIQRVYGKKNQHKIPHIVLVIFIGIRRGEQERASRSGRKCLVPPLSNKAFSNGGFAKQTSAQVDEQRQTPKRHGAKQITSFRPDAVEQTNVPFCHCVQLAKRYQSCHMTQTAKWNRTKDVSKYFPNLSHRLTHGRMYLPDATCLQGSRRDAPSEMLGVASLLMSKLLRWLSFQ